MSQLVKPGCLAQQQLEKNISLSSCLSSILVINTFLNKPSHTTYIARDITSDKRQIHTIKAIPRNSLKKKDYYSKKSALAQYSLEVYFSSTSVLLKSIGFRDQTIIEALEIVG